jgi:hypothetical protein
MELQVLPTLSRVYESLGLVPTEDLIRGLAQLEARMARLAVEAVDAEAQGRSLADAVDDEHNFPTLHRLHIGVRDLLTMSLPPPLLGWVKQVLAAPESPVTDGLQRGLAALAADAGAPPTARALARLLLFEAVRVNLVVAEHLSGSSIAAVGALPGDIDAIAEAQVNRWIADDAGDGDKVRPLNVLVAAGLVALERHIDDLKDVLARLSGDLNDAFRLRAALELKLREMDAADAVLIRNAFAPALDEQRLEVERLAAEHPLLLGARRRDALDQQVSRLRRRMVEGDWPRRRGTALIDLLAESDE